MSSDIEDEKNSSEFFEPLLHANLFMLYKTMIQLGGTACIKMN
jgi:hypothetical protein